MASDIFTSQKYIKPPRASQQKPLQTCPVQVTNLSLPTMKYYRFLIPVLAILALIQGSCPDDEKAKKMNSTDYFQSSSDSNNTNLQQNGEMAKLLFLLDISNYVLFAEAIFGILTNSFLIFVIFIDPLKRLRETKSTALIVNLGLQDLLTSWVTVFYAFPPEESSFHLLGVLLWLGYSSSLFTLLFFTFERFIATIYPLRVKQLIFYEKSWVACLASWIMGAFLANMFFYSKEDNVFELLSIVRSGLLEIVVIVIVIFNIGIVVSVRKHSYNMIGQRCNTGLDKKQRQMNAVLFILVFMLLVTVLPFFITEQVYHIYIWCQMSSRKCFQVSQSTYLKIVAVPRLILPICTQNSLLNPIVYAWRLGDYRASALALFRKKPSLPNSSSTRFTSAPT